MKSDEKIRSLKIAPADDERQNTSSTSTIDASVLAKLAEDVIAWNRPLTPNEVEMGARPAQVAKLTSLSRGFKIKREDKEQSEAPKSSEGVVTLLKVSKP